MSAADLADTFSSMTNDNVIPKLVYAYRIGNTASEKNPNEIVWLCTDMSGTPTTFGSNNFNRYTSLVQLVGYIPEELNHDVRYQELGLEIIKFLRSKGYMLSYYEAVRAIPDSPRKQMTFHFRYTESV